MYSKNFKIIFNRIIYFIIMKLKSAKKHNKDQK